MTTLKTSKKMNLAELIQWAWDNPEDASNEQYTSTSDDGSTIFIDFNDNGNMYMDDHYYYVSKECEFEVKTYEEITEETKIPLLLEVYSDSDNDNINTATWKDKSISDEKGSSSKTFHMIKPDGTTTLLWTKEDGLVWWT